MGHRRRTSPQLAAARDIYYLTPDGSRTPYPVNGNEVLEDIARFRHVAWEKMREVWSHGFLVKTTGQNSLRGTPVNSGVAIGTARIVREASDFMKLNPATF